MEDRVQRHLLAEQVEDLAPSALLLLAGELEGGVELFLNLGVAVGALPVHTLVGPHVGGVPPAHEQVSVVTEDRGVTGGDQYVVGVGVTVDGAVDVSGLLLVVADLYAQGLEVFLEDGAHGGEPVVVGGQHLDLGYTGFR